MDIIKVTAFNLLQLHSAKSFNWIYTIYQCIKMCLTAGYRAAYIQADHGVGVGQAPGIQ